MKLLFGIGMGVVVGLFVATVRGQELSPGNGSDVRAVGVAQGVVGKLRKRGARVTRLGDVGGLSGWLVELGKNDAYTLYVGADGYSVAGLMYGPDGSLLTGSQLSSAGKGDVVVKENAGRGAAAGSAGGVPPEAVGAEGRSQRRGFTVVAQRPQLEAKRAPAGLVAKSAGLFGFTLGHRGKVVVMLADPGCEWSKRAVESLGREALRGKFRLRVIPVGVLAGSVEEAVRIASSVDPALAWFGRDVEKADRAGVVWIEESNAVFESWGENAVPLIAWPAGAGGYVYRVGVIPDVAGWVEEVFGS